jgi:hypothetical protein
MEELRGRPTTPQLADINNQYTLISGMSFVPFKDIINFANAHFWTLIMLIYALAEILHRMNCEHNS